MNDNAFTFRENINMQCHLIFRPTEETEASFYDTSSHWEKHFWDRGFFDAFQFAYLSLDEKQNEYAWIKEYWESEKLNPVMVSWDQVKVDFTVEDL